MSTIDSFPPAPAASSGLDPIGLKILWDRLVSITFETGRTLEKAAFSIVIREGKDYAVLLTDANGDCIAQPWDCAPSFLGPAITVKAFLQRYSADQLGPGDSLITNDPWVGTGHLNDVSIATPIFDTDDKLLGFAACIAHVSDIGGSLNFGATREVYEEGLLIPISKLEAGGMVNEDVLSFIRANVRVPESVIGDVMAMLAANRVAAARVTELVEKSAITGFQGLAAEIIGRTEDAMRSAIRELPEGTYHGESSGDGFSGPFTIRAALTVQAGQIVVDFTGTSGQTPSSLNSVYAYTYAYTVYPLKLLLQGGVPNNEGTFRPIHVIAPEGSILNAQRPVAVDKRNLVGHFITPTLMQALAEALPHRVTADSGSTPAQFETWSGTREDGRYFLQMVHHVGGMGASSKRDGEIACFPSNLGGTPTEVVEAQAPLLVKEKRLLPNSAGAGMRRGGYGQRVTTKNISGHAVAHNIIPCRFRYPPRGIHGGFDAGVYSLRLNGDPHPKPQGRWELQPGDEVTVDYPGGGGYGPPHQRDAGHVAEDVAEGLLTAELAAELYGPQARDSEKV